MTELLQTDSLPEDSLMDLDELLASSVLKAKAKKLKANSKSFRRLPDADSAELLKLAEKMEEEATWKSIALVAHSIHSTCDCGNSGTDFNGMYEIFQHKTQTGSKKTKRMSGLTATNATHTHTTYRKVHACAKCLTAYNLPSLSVEHESLFSFAKET